MKKINVHFLIPLLLKSKNFYLLIIFTIYSTIGISQNTEDNGVATIGTEVKVRYESPHPYPTSNKSNNSTQGKLVWTQKIKHTNASYVAVHFSKFKLAKGDYLIVRSPDNVRQWEYTEKGNNNPNASNNGFWSIPINGETLIIDIYSKNATSDYGYSIDKIAAGFSKSNKIINGDDNTQNAICYETTEPDVYEKSRAIARLHIEGVGTCTGWLVGSEGHIMTNYHCLPADPTNVIVEMMAEGANCDDDCEDSGACPGIIEATTVTMVKSDYQLDYALLALPTNITDTYGYLQIRETEAELDERIYMPQHPAGWGKRIALETDDDDATIVSVTEPNCFVLNNNFMDVLGYYIDTQGGSSGSPVLSYESNLVIGLHNCGPATGTNFGKNRAVPILNIVEHMGSDIPDHSLACDDDYSPEFTFETSCDNGNFSVTAASDLPDNVGSYWGIFQTTVQGSTLTSETIDGDPSTVDVIDPIQTVQWGNSATFSNLDISGHFYIKHGIWRDGCFTWVESRVALPEFEGVSAFHFENAQGLDFPSGSSYCYGKDVYINGTASEGEDRYYLGIKRRPIGSNASYSDFAALGWTLNSTVGVINLSERLHEFDSDLYFEPGYQYRVALAIANIEDCIGWTLETHSILIECCDYVHANFNSSISQSGLVTAASNADVENIPDFESEVWYLMSSTEESGGNYTFVDISEGPNYSHQTQDEDVYYFLFHQVIDDCGETCFGELVQGGEFIPNDDDQISCNDIECALTDYYVHSFDSHISQSGLVTASYDVDYSYIINPESEIWYLVSSVNESGGDYTFVDAHEGNSYSYQTQNDDLYYFLFHQIVSECGEYCFGELVQGGEFIPTDLDPLSCDDIECAVTEYYYQYFNSHISQSGLVTAFHDVDFSQIIDLDSEIWFLVSSENEAGGDYNYVNTQEGDSFSYQTENEELYYFLFHQVNSSECGELCFGELVQGGEFIANDNDPLSCDDLGCSILNSYNNSLNISIVDEGENLDELSIEVQCGSEVELTYIIIPGAPGANAEDIVLEAAIPAGYALIPGDGLSSFGSGGIVTLSNISEEGFQVTLTLEAIDLMDVGTLSEVDIIVESSSPSGYICSDPSITLVSTEVCKGDANGDGAITASDLTAFLGVFGEPSSPCGIFDFDDNGYITASDLTDFLAVYGTTCPDDAEGLIGKDEQIDISSATLEGEIFDELFRLSSLNIDAGLLIYPNPVTSEVFVEAKNVHEGTFVKIYNTSGKVLVEKQMDKGKNRLDLTSQTPGIYLIAISDSKGRIMTSSRIVKN